jgi:mono/diheme cytochrome c family protein
MRRHASKIRWGVAVVIGALLLVQAVPYGRAHKNPAPTEEARWGDARARELFASACADCHSDHTRWRWYSNVAPASWLVEHDVDEGRRVLNFSEWDRAQPALDEVLSQILGGGMPPLQYKLGHPAARLSAGERRALAEALRSVYATDPPAGVRGG